MFHAFQIVSQGFSWNSSKFQNLHREDARNFLMSPRLYEELEPVWVESSEFFQVTCHLYRKKGRNFGIFLSPKAYMGGGATSEFFKVPCDLYEVKAWNFSKSHGGARLHGESSEYFQVPETIPSLRAYMGVPDPIYRHISSYSSIFLHISSYFHHIYYIKELPNVFDDLLGISL